MDKLTITIPAFPDGGAIPLRNTARGEDISPEIRLSGLDPAARSLAVTLDDADHPLFPGFNHWLIWNVPPSDVIPEGIPRGASPAFPAGASQGMAYGALCYKGPKPPFRWQHRYVFTVYALDTQLELPGGAKREDFLAAAEGHVLQTARYTGRFQSRGRWE